MYINVEESGTKWCEVVDEILFGGRSDLSDFSSTERQVFVLCSRSEEHTSELQSLTTISYAVF